MTSAALDKPRLVSSPVWHWQNYYTRYRVNDLEKTVEFYETVLGLRGRQSRRAAELAFLKAPSEETIEICHQTAGGGQEDLTHLAFEVDSLEEFATPAAWYRISTAQR